MSTVACQGICVIAANASSERTAFAIAQVFFLRNYAKEPPCNCGNRQFPQFHGGTFVQVQQTARSRICRNNCCASGACRHLRKRFFCPIAHREVKVYGGSWVSVSSAPVPAACLKRQAWEGSQTHMLRVRTRPLLRDTQPSKQLCSVPRI